MDTADWRTQVPLDYRRRIVNKMLDAFKRHLLVSGQEDLHELREIIVRFDENIYTAATSQSDYLRKISLKMLALEIKCQTAMASNLPSNSAASHSMQSQGQLLPGPLVAPNQSQMSQQLLPQNIQTDTIASVTSLNQTPPMPNFAGQNFGMQNIFDIPQNSAFAVPNQSQTSQQLLPQNIQSNTIASVTNLNQTPPMPNVAGQNFGMQNIFDIPQNSAFAVPNWSQTSQQLLPQNIQTNTIASVASLNQTPPMPYVAGHYFGMENIFGIPQNSAFAVPNQSQTSQQLLPQNIQTNTMASVTSLNQTLPMPNVAGQNFGMENIFDIPQDSVEGNSMGQEAPSNMFANSQWPGQGRPP